MSENATTIHGTYLEALFDLICSTYEKHGSNLFGGWEGWPTLNEYYPCHLPGNYIKTDEHNFFSGFISHHGSHPCLGSRVAGDEIQAFEELKEVLRLELTEDRDNSNSMTYPGCRVKYWKINHPDFIGENILNVNLNDLPVTTDGERFANVLNVLKELSQES